jgi:hypothetical protein
MLPVKGGQRHVFALSNVSTHSSSSHLFHARNCVTCDGHNPEAKNLSRTIIQGERLVVPLTLVVVAATAEDNDSSATARIRYHVNNKKRSACSCIVGPFQ